MSAVAAIFASVTALAVAFLVVEFGFRHVLVYANTPTHLEVRLFGCIPVYRVALRDVVDAAPWHFSFADITAMFTTLRLGNRIAGTAVVIQRRSGFPRYVVITPDDPAGTIAALRATTSSEAPRA